MASTMQTSLVCKHETNYNSMGGCPVLNNKRPVRLKNISTKAEAFDSLHTGDVHGVKWCVICDNLKCPGRTGPHSSSDTLRRVSPSRIETKLLPTGQIISRFWTTHVRHEEEMRNQHLSKMVKKDIVKKLLDGVTVDRIITDALKVNSDKLKRIHIILNRKDVSYLAKKHNVMKIKRLNSMIAVDLKVKEWNGNGKNNCYFFKQQGESHPVLYLSDFYLGFENDDMGGKLKDFSKMICMDGTHCTEPEPEGNGPDNYACQR